MLLKFYKSIIFTIFLISSFFLQSCSSQNKVPDAIRANTKKMKKTIYKDKNNIDYIIAFYNLVEHGNLYKNYPFPDYYPLLINDDKFLHEYSEKMNEKIFSFKIVQNVAYNKINFLLETINKLRKKYKSIENIPFLLKLKLKINPSNKLDHLVLLDEYYSNLPFLVPQYASRITSFFGNRCMTVKIKTQILKNTKTKNKNNKSSKKITKYTTKNTCKMHFGIDLQSKQHDIYAAGGALVEDVRRDWDFGNNIILNHGWNIKTKYAHLNKTFVKRGDYVVRGQKIGTQGCTGKSTGPHLHFEIIIDNVRINPEEFINFREVCK